MPINESDRRVQKTRKLLQDAMITLLSEKDFEAITIQELLDRANVGRSTFYMHYEGKNDLLHSCFSGFETLLGQFNPGNDNGQPADRQLSGFFMGVYKFVGQNRRLFSAFLKQGGAAMCGSSIHINFIEYISAVLKTMPQSRKLTPLQLDMTAHYLAYAFIGVLTWWLNADIPCTAEEAASRFKQIATVDIRDVFR